MKFLKTFETHENGMSREEMYDMLCKCGYSQEELDGCSNYELENMCKTAGEVENSSNETNESKTQWIKDAIKRPGSLRKKMKKEEGDKITKSEIEDEISQLKKKDEDPSKPGIQGLSKKDLTKFRQLNLAKTLKGLKEHQEQENYMFFANVENICKFCQEILAMDKNSVDAILSDGHGWATDHIATSKDDVEEVVNFLRTHKVSKKADKPEMHSMDKEFVKRFTDFPGAHNL